MKIEFPDGHGSHRCKSSVHVALDLFKGLLLQQASKNGGHLTKSEIERLTEEFKASPGKLSSFYELCFDKCQNSAREALGESNHSAPTFLNNLTKIVEKRSGPIVSGRLQVIGLDDIKERLGDRWPAASTRVISIAEKIIGRRLSPEDAVSRKADEFVICFARLSEQEALFKTQAIAREIRQTLLGEMEEVDCPKVTAEAYELELSLESIQESNNPLDLMLTKINQMSDRKENHVRTTLRELESCCKFHLRPVKQTRDGHTAPFMLAGFDRYTQTKMQKISATQFFTDEAAAKFDTLRLAQVAHHLHEQLEDNGPTYIFVNVKFSTLDNKLYSEKYFDLCHSFMSDFQESVIFNIVDIPSDTFLPRFIEVIGSIRPYSFQLAVQMKALSVTNLDLYNTQIKHVVFEHEDMLAMLRENRKALRNFVSRLHQHKMSLIVDLLTDKDDWRVAKELGVDFAAFDS